jgi:hypothetical protein
MPKRKVYDFNGVAIDLNNVNYVERVGSTYDGYALKFTFWSGAFKIVSYYRFDDMYKDYQFAVAKLND